MTYSYDCKTLCTVKFKSKVSMMLHKFFENFCFYSWFKQMVCNIEKKDTKINISQEKQCTVDHEWPLIAARQADVQNSPPIKGA